MPYDSQVIWNIIQDSMPGYLRVEVTISSTPGSAGKE